MTKDNDNSNVSKSAKEERTKNIVEFMEDYYKKPFREIQIDNAEEVDWGSPVGEETW